ncbi:NAD-dependent succinate-semialdehyde dehydrogenase [Reinekea sp. G2M2-21]|uniref:NAD-dependent succinate-semialdehyde dehydrogenase n=1 Tax=Reinekea sp. G2M2-21 TaxID=2788942 RepID=UPI001E5DBA76|nr:NAD-dependent succinate-semialdehyde dehydrogenase [Reinekea sp. G2M2-21]
MTIHPKLMADTSYVGGQWLTGAKTFAVTNPATGDVLAHVADADVAVAQQAVQAAKDAFPAWRAKTASERSAILRKWFNLMMEYQHELGVIMTLEQGKPLAEAKGEVGYGASFVEWFAEEGKRIYGDTIPAPSNDKRLLVIKQPVGVVASITPWNFPNSMITRKAAPALAAGCTFVIRPSELTPLSALALAKLAEMAGIPEGVFNVVVGTDAKGIGKVFTESPDVAKFSFTGSTAVGKQLIAQSASTVKKVSMELGGNAPFIVFDDADLDAAVTGALASKYRNAGQTCVCANRILVQESVHDAFVEKFVKAVNDMRVGNGMSEGVAIGPLIHEKAMQDIHQRVEDSVAAGAKVALGGHGHALGGSFYTPTVLTQVTNDMPISAIEIFGPVAPVIKFSTEAEAIAIANDTEFGLAAYFYSRDIGRIWRVSEGLDYGMVGINEGIISNAAAPFGGMKSSGLGREGSKYGIDEYIEIKYLCMGGLNA